MIRKIIRIDKEKCNGCGACADACHEGAISFEEREAPAYDEMCIRDSHISTQDHHPDLPADVFEHFYIRLQLTQVSIKMYEM